MERHYLTSQAFQDNRDDAHQNNATGGKGAFELSLVDDSLAEVQISWVPTDHVAAVVDVSLHGVRVDVDSGHPVAKLAHERVVGSGADSAHAQDQDFGLGNVDRPLLGEASVGLEAQ